MSPDGRPAFLSPPARRRQSRVWPDRAHRQKHRWPGPDCPHPNSHLTAREITCSDCGLRQRQSASSNPPAESLKNHIIEGVFTQPGSKPDLTAPKTDFRFTPESGLKSDIAPCPKSANSGSRRLLFDHLHLTGEQRGWDSQPSPSTSLRSAS